jgi:non-ribosomal peptide synthetase-like protein
MTVFGQEDKELLRDETLLDIFHASASRHPNGPAIASEGRQVTYGQLSRQVESLSQVLAAQGIGRGARVITMLPRGIDTCAALLAVMKTGAAYVPVDPSYPDERCAFIATDCQATAILTTTELLPRAAALGPPAMAIDTGDFSFENKAQTAGNRPDSALPDDIAYIIYTSGTTGKPKGVPITHRNACHFVRAEGKLFGIKSDDRIYHGFSLSFDASIEELWLAWFASALLVIAPEDIARSGSDLATWLAQHNVTVLSCVPTLLSLFEDEIPSLRLLILGGEVCPPSLVARWATRGRLMVNTYGPTEATVVATYAWCEADKPVTIGRPLPNYIACILDSNLRPVNKGDSGELCLGGPGLAKGYLNRPELTETKFIANPNQDEAGAPERLYRTGDRVRLTEQDQLEFLGRVDDQVKLRGYRIELGEVESALRALPGISQAAATVCDDGLGLTQLVGYVVPAVAAALAFDEAAARALLRAQLPSFMVPALLEVVPSIPTLTSGKVDRSSLPAPRLRQVSEISSEAGLTEMEHRVMAIWQSLFASQSIGREDNFFDLGGHSLLAARMISELRRQPGLSQASVVDVYRHPQLSEFASALQALVPVEAKPSQSGPQVRPVGPLGRWCCWSAQVLGLYLAFAIFSLQWFLPWFVFDYFEDLPHRALFAGLLALAVAFAIEPVQMLVCVALKWIVIGRYREGDYPLWGFYYWRFWLVHTIYRQFSFSNFEGTPLLPIFSRMMGARIGKDVYIATPCQFGDLIEVGEGTSINAAAQLLFFRVEDGLLKLRRIRIGSNCEIAQSALVEGGATMEDNSRLGPLSLLPEGAVLPKGQTWEGSPARRVEGDRETPATKTTEPKNKFILACIYGIGFPALAFFPLLAAVPGMLLLAWVDNNFNWYWSVATAPVVVGSFMLFFALQIVVAKRILLGNVASGRYAVHSGFYMRHWFCDRLLHTSLDLLFPAYSTLYLPPWLRLLGARLGKRAEVSTIMHFTPDLLEIGEEAFVADAASVGAANVSGGFLDLLPVKIGAQSFVGNSAVIPGGTVLGDKSLIGCLSIPPSRPSDRLRYDASWMGSPAVFLPNRLINTSFADELTYRPTKKLYAQRLSIELLRMILPGTVLVATSIVLMYMASEYGGELTWPEFIAVFPLFSVLLGLVAATVTIAAKWLIIGRYRAGESPLWSTFVWRSELVTAMHDYLATPTFLTMLRGTPFLSWYLRALGAKVGSSVYFDSTYMTEFDLVEIGSNCYINTDCDLQTHLFEDRVMKMSYVRLGERCSAGAFSLVLYDTKLQDGTVLAPLSLVLKGETLSAGSGRWIGSPVRAEVRQYDAQE